jgi:polyphosphate kinase
MDIVESSFFRVTRDADFTVSDEADDLLAAIEAELRRMRFGEVVRLEIRRGMTGDARDARAAPSSEGRRVRVDGC